VTIQRVIQLVDRTKRIAIPHHRGRDVAHNYLILSRPADLIWTDTREDVTELFPSRDNERTPKSQTTGICRMNDGIHCPSLHNQCSDRCHTEDREEHARKRLARLDGRRQRRQEQADRDSGYNALSITTRRSRAITATNIQTHERERNQGQHRLGNHRNVKQYARANGRKTDDDRVQCVQADQSQGAAQERYNKATMRELARDANVVLRERCAARR